VIECDLVLLDEEIEDVAEQLLALLLVVSGEVNFVLLDDDNCDFELVRFILVLPKKFEFLLKLAVNVSLARWLVAPPPPALPPVDEDDE
jgi:hypothetical protein